MKFSLHSFAFASFFTFASIVMAADPVAVLEGPDKAPVYTPVIVSAAKSTPGWTKLDITPKPPYLEKLDGSKTLRFFGPPGKYTVTLQLFVPPDKDGNFFMGEATHVVEVMPGNSPDPSPDSKLGVARISYDFAALLPTEAKAKAPAVAQCLRTAAADFRSGALKWDDASMRELSSRVYLVFGDQQSLWTPWLTAFRASVQLLGASGVLEANGQSMAAALEEAAAGLDKLR